MVRQGCEHQLYHWRSLAVVKPEWVARTIGQAVKEGVIWRRCNPVEVEIIGFVIFGTLELSENTFLDFPAHAAVETG